MDGQQSELQRYQDYEQLVKHNGWKKISVQSAREKLHNILSLLFTLIKIQD